MDLEQHIRRSNTSLIQALDGTVKWKYDNFNRALLAEFSADKAPLILSVIRQHLPMEWDAKSIKRADQLVKHQAGSYVKINQQQKLFAPQNNEPTSCMLAWWPWGHGATVSIRLFSANQEPFVSKKSFLKRLSQFFG